MEGFTVLGTPPLTGNRARVRRYRSRHRRIDYVPSFDVLPIIQHHLDIGTDPCLAGVIDYLVEGCGADRVVYGSDQPMRDPRQQLGWVVFSRMPVDQKRMVLRDNAQRTLSRIRAHRT